MMLICIFVILMAFGTFGEEYTPELDEYLFNPFLPLLNPINAYDGPSYIANARTTPTSNRLPTKAQMMYYNYYAASIDYFYDLDDLSCEYCLIIKPYISEYKVLKNDTHNTLGIVALSEIREEIVVAFRGTGNLWNIFLDVLLINSRPNNTSNIKIHTGFYIATMSLYAKVVKTIAGYRKDHQAYKIVIAGHSLGAAMSRLTYYFLKDLKQFKDATYELYTFGEPRVGNRAFADFMNSQTITRARVVHRADIVCHIPPTSILGSDSLFNYYHHSQTEYWIYGVAGQRFCDQNVYEDHTCSNSIGPAYSLVDHFTYFDVNVASAFGQTLQLASVPFNILPVENLPPLPKFIENPLGDVLDGVISSLLPTFG